LGKPAYIFSADKIETEDREEKEEEEEKEKEKKKEKKKEKEKEKEKEREREKQKEKQKKKGAIIEGVLTFVGGEHALVHLVMVIINISCCPPCVSLMSTRLREC
jgi:ATP-dependent 26S proteasome regulatory subunit